VGPILYMVVISHDVEGTSYEESGWHINSFLLCLFTVPAKSFYGLELHHLTPSRIVCMVAFVTLCEAYMGIDTLGDSR
jgi:hypothetical protein